MVCRMISAEMAGSFIATMDPNAEKIAAYTIAIIHDVLKNRRKWEKYKPKPAEITLR